MGGGIRVGSEESGPSDDLSAIDSSPPPLQRQRPDAGFLQRLVTPLPWEERLTDAMFAPSSDVAAMAPPPPRPVLPPVQGYAPTERSPRENPMRPSNLNLSPEAQTERHARMVGPQARVGLASPPPQSPASSAPVVKGNLKGTQRPGTSPQTALPLYFAKAMGYAVPGESGDAEEARFSRAADIALRKMTKGMSVAKFLAGHQSPKMRDLFGKLLDTELRKQTPATGGKTPPNNPELATTSRLPLQPDGG